MDSGGNEAEPGRSRASCTVVVVRTASRNKQQNVLQDIKRDAKAVCCVETAKECSEQHAAAWFQLIRFRIL